MTPRALSDDRLLQAFRDAAEAVRLGRSRMLQPAILATLVSRRDALEAELVRRDPAWASGEDRASAAAVAPRGDQWWLFYCPAYDDPIKAALVAYKRARAAGAGQAVLEELEAALREAREAKQEAILAAMGTIAGSETRLPTHP
ncbi:hypothetical protein [Muricoccus nepalensis]|uniref:hypothetical protein n=1 Tax=Muricoccus nepalensis TaxID=1854500 RepID=UPI0013870D16|nr:hypothetical protein [Roseomonas nepalensis]